MMHKPGENKLSALNLPEGSNPVGMLKGCPLNQAPIDELIQNSQRKQRKRTSLVSFSTVVRVLPWEVGEGV